MNETLKRLNDALQRIDPVVDASIWSKGQVSLNPEEQKRLEEERRKA